MNHSLLLRCSIWTMVVTCLLTASPVLSQSQNITLGKAPTFSNCRLKCKGNNEYLEALPGASTNGKPLRTSPYDKSNSGQVWILQKQSNGVYYIQNSGQKKYLDADGASSSDANGRKVQLWDRVVTPHQEWNILPIINSSIVRQGGKDTVLVDQCYKITNNARGKGLQVSDAGWDKQDNKIMIWDVGNTAFQEWYIEEEK